MQSCVHWGTDVGRGVAVSRELAPIPLPLVVRAYYDATRNAGLWTRNAGRAVDQESRAVDQECRAVDQESRAIVMHLLLFSKPSRPVLGCQVTCHIPLIPHASAAVTQAALALAQLPGPCPRHSHPILCSPAACIPCRPC